MKKAIKARLERIQATQVGAGVGILGSALIAGAAHADVDLTGVTSSFTDLTTALTTVGGLIITAAGTAIVFKWVKGMIFS